MTFPLVYLVQYLVGALLLWLLVGKLGLQPTVALVVVVAATLPMTFALTRFLLRRPAD